ncbi:MAG: hypothetical protein KF773_05700 [Deltaproteobacteria bacterium]|nr:hypothetical protein [Deltaproteobacteria bacterium]
MSYRDDSVDLLEAPTAEGKLSCELAPRAVRLTVARRTVQIADGHVTLVEHRKKAAKNEANSETNHETKIGTKSETKSEKKREKKDRTTHLEIAGRLVIARDVPRDDLGLWIELDPGDDERRGMRRIFGVEPMSTLEPDGLAALAVLDRFAQRIRVELDAYAGDVLRAIELGRGLDKVLVTDHGDRYVVYARRLFRDRARVAMTVFSDGRIRLVEGKDRDITVRSRHGVDVIGDYVRFSAPDGVDLGKVSIPWIAPEDRRELARRIGQLVDPGAAAQRDSHPT